MNIIRKIKEDKISKIIAFAGNPNVGKSTVFNGITGMKQHTGNWPGKTVVTAEGYYFYNGEKIKAIDLPGTYSLISHSGEEEVARDFICFEKYDGIVCVCDATCLERNLNLVLQILEITNNVTLCVNLMDEAEKKYIKIDLEKLEKILGIKVLGISAKNNKDIKRLIKDINFSNKGYKVKYEDNIEEAINTIEEKINELYKDIPLNKRWIAEKIICNDNEMIREISEKYQINLLEKSLNDTVIKEFEKLEQMKIYKSDINDIMVSKIVSTAEKISKEVIYEDKNKKDRDIKIDRIMTDKFVAYPLMFLFLGLIFFITIVGANYPSQMLSDFLFSFEDNLIEFTKFIRCPMWLSDMLIFGMYRVVAWVVSVMFPPMAIFFPMFTFLEDLGFLPRIAFNLDYGFKKCNACGKQALTMW